MIIDNERFEYVKFNINNTQADVFSGQHAMVHGTRKIKMNISSKRFVDDSFAILKN